MLEAFLVRLLNLRSEDFVAKEFICYVYGPLYYHYFLKTIQSLYVISEGMMPSIIQMKLWKELKWPSCPY